MVDILLDMIEGDDEILLGIKQELTHAFIECIIIFVIHPAVVLTELNF
jgi:hypothetical protein